VSASKGQRGLTLVELVLSIVIISVTGVALIAAVSTVAGRSADPMVRAQALAIAGAYLEEVSLAPLCDPAYNPDGNAATTCRSECTTRPCVGGCGGASFGAESGRADFDDVCDYDGLVDNGAHDRQGNALPELAGYRVDVSVLDGASVSLGSPAITPANGRVVRIEVEVTHDAIEEPLRLVAYRANLE
jgi:MSHA pilin protein MshD